MSKKYLWVLALVALLLILTRKAMKYAFFAFQKIRNDAEGSGYFGAPRGNRKHQGVDLETTEGKQVKAPEAGTIKRKAYPYKGDANYTGLIFNGDSGTEWRVYYVKPLEALIGQRVEQGQTIATSQDISKKYGPLMKAHIHVEARQNGKLINPTEILQL